MSVARIALAGLLAAVSLATSGCTPVRPWERDVLIAVYTYTKVALIHSP